MRQRELIGSFAASASAVALSTSIQASVDDRIRHSGNESARMREAYHGENGHSPSFHRANGLLQLFWLLLFIVLKTALAANPVPGIHAAGDQTDDKHGEGPGVSARPGAIHPKAQ